MSENLDHRKGTFYEVGNVGFGVYDQAKDELLHPHENSLVNDVSTTETHYFGISVPEENIHGMYYLQYRPKVNTVSGGVWVFQGIKPHVLTCEIFDWPNYMSDNMFASNDLRDYTLDNGTRVQMLEEGKRFKVTYSDTKRDNKIDLEYEAAMPVVMYGSGLHFEQGVKMTGELILRGKKYDVNSYNIRDRSWGQPRTEVLQSMPPLTWMTGSFGDDLFFNCSAFDSPQFATHWKGVDKIPNEKICPSGWIYIDGETLEVVACEKKTTHNPNTLYHEVIEIDMTDSRGNHHKMVGRIVAACRMSVWLNQSTVLGYIRWDYNGRTGYGDAQDVQTADFIYNNLLDE